MVRIFEDFATGLSPRKIAQKLNAENIPGPGGRIWRDTTIRGHATHRTGLLRNDLYVGKLVWNKQHYIKDPSTGRRLARPNPPEQWITHDLPELRIVEQELWDTVQERLGHIRNSETVRKARATKFWEKRRATNLLTGKVTCGHCSGRYSAVGRDYLACGTARQTGTCSNARSIRRPILEALILDALKHNLMQPELVEEFTTAFHDEINRQTQNDAAEKERIQRQLDRQKKRLDGLIEAIADGLRTSGTIAKLEELERQTADLEQQLASTPGSRPILHPNLAKLYRKKVGRLHDTLDDPAFGHEALEILRGLIDEVRLEGTEDAIEIELIGDIAGMVELANGAGHKKKQAAFDEKTACSVKVVAGARNCFDLLLSASFAAQVARVRNHRELHLRVAV